MTVGELIEFFEWVYDKNGFLTCDSMPDDGQHFTDTAWDLFVDFVCERGPAHRHFDAYDYLTQELAQSSLIHDIRQRFYEGNATPIPRTEVEFGLGGFLQATLDNLVAGYTEDFINDWPGGGNGRVIAWHTFRHANITHFMGSFDYEVSLVYPAMAKFVVTNYTERASGSHFPGRFGPEYDLYLEGLVQQHPELASEHAISFIRSNPVIAVLYPRPRSRTYGSMGGGTVQQTFTWLESYPLLGCTKWLPPWPLVLKYLKIYHTESVWI